MISSDALTASISVVRSPREPHFAADVLRKDSLVVVEPQVELPGTFAEQPSLLVLIDRGPVVGDADRRAVVVVGRDGGVLHAGVALVAGLFIVSNRNQNAVTRSLRSQELIIAEQDINSFLANRKRLVESNTALPSSRLGNESCVVTLVSSAALALLLFDSGIRDKACQLEIIAIGQA